MRHSTRSFASAPVWHVETSTDDEDEDVEGAEDEIRLVRSMPVRYEKPRISRIPRNEPPPAPTILRPAPEVRTREGSR